ncbi:MAG: hypothetical protein ACON4Z_16335 [Planctomycetota bacterium]
MTRAAALAWLFAAAAPLTAQAPMAVSVPHAQDCDVAATATARELRLELRLADGFYAYTRDVGGGGPVTLALDPACGFEATGPLLPPEDKAGKVSGAAVWRLPIRPRRADAELRATAWLQVCDELMCHAPERVEISGRPGGFPVLLVSGARDERSGRVAAFLAARGLDVDVTTYAEATAAMCERAEVVLCDSKRFRETAKVREHVLAFPKTTTPIVAVGFFGTELVEAHGVAMTSGYV